MSYSRWSNSAWYCFDSSVSPNRKEDHILSLWYDFSTTKNWSYLALKEFDEERIQSEYPNATPEEVKEAMGYIKDFLGDCDELLPRL